MNKLTLSLLFTIIISNNTCIGQNIQSVSLSSDCITFSLGSINQILLDKQMPFCFKFYIDTTEENLYCDTIITLEYKNENKLINIYSLNPCYNCFWNILKHKDYYRIEITELLVGYDYFLIIKEKPFQVYLSDNYNFDQDEPYNFVESSINFKNGVIEIYYPESQTTEKVFFKPLKIE
jgi:hypothetical protein